MTSVIYQNNDFPFVEKSALKSPRFTVYKDFLFSKVKKRRGFNIPIYNPNDQYKYAIKTTVQSSSEDGENDHYPIIPHLNLPSMNEENQVHNLDQNDDYIISDIYDDSNGDSNDYYMKKLRYFLMMYTTFTEGLEEGLQLNVVYFMKYDLLLGPAAATLAWGISRFPWLFKPIFAFISDTSSNRYGRRKPFLLGSAIIHVISLLALSQIHLTHYSFLYSITIPILLLSLRSTARAWTAAISQAILVENAHERMDSNFLVSGVVSDFFWMRAVGILIASVGVGSLLMHMPPHKIFGWFSLFPATTILTSLFLTEPPVTQTRSVSESCSDLIETVKSQPKILYSLIYFFTYMAGPNYDNALYYFYIDVLGFSPIIMGQIQMFKGIARLTGPILYKYFFRSWSFHKLVYFLTLSSIPLYVSPILITSGFLTHYAPFISPLYFALSGEYIREAVLYIQILPPIIYACHVTPKGLEGSIFALFTTVQGVGSGACRVISGVVTAIFGVAPPLYTGLSSLIVFCSTTLVLPLPILKYIPKDEIVGETDNEKIPIQP